MVKFKSKKLANLQNKYTFTIKSIWTKLHIENKLQHLCLNKVNLLNISVPPPRVYLMETTPAETRDFNFLFFSEAPKRTTLTLKYTFSL